MTTQYVLIVTDLTVRMKSHNTMKRRKQIGDDDKKKICARLINVNASAYEQFLQFAVQDYTISVLGDADNFTAM